MSSAKDACLSHLASRLLPACRTPGDACCAAVAVKPPDPVACSPRWASTLQIHAERARAANTNCSSSASAGAPAPRVCPFISPAALTPCDAPECARLWSAGEMDAACTVAIANYCSAGGGAPVGCTWYAAAHAPCRQHVSTGNSSWYACSTLKGYAPETSVLDESAAVKARALRKGHTTASMDAFVWMHGADASVHKTFISYYVSPTSIRFAAARGSSDPFLLYTPVVSAAAIALPIFVVATMVYFAILETVRAEAPQAKRA